MSKPKYPEIVIALPADGDTGVIRNRAHKALTDGPGPEAADEYLAQTNPYRNYPAELIELTRAWVSTTGDVDGAALQSSKPAAAGPTGRGAPSSSGGFVKGTKAAVLAVEAERAVHEGRSIFAPMLNTPISQSASFQMSGSISGWAEMIEAVEAQGWALVHWSVATDQRGRPQAYPLFRRSP